MSKYDRLSDFLSAASGDSVDLTFGQVEVLVGALPPSALVHSAWWSNEEDGQHVQAHAWTRAGWTANVNLERRRVSFSRKSIR